MDITFPVSNTSVKYIRLPRFSGLPWSLCFKVSVRCLVGRRGVISSVRGRAWNHRPGRGGGQVDAQSAAQEFVDSFFRVV